MDYQGGSYFYNALQGVGEDFQKAIERHKELQKQKEFSDDTVGYMARNKDMHKYLMTDKDTTLQDALNRYNSASLSAKGSFAQSALANMNMDMKKQEMESKAEEMRAMAEYRKALAAQREQGNVATPPGYHLDDQGNVVGVSEGGKFRVLTPQERFQLPGQQQPAQPAAPQQSPNPVSNAFSSVGSNPFLPDFSKMQSSGATRQVSWLPPMIGVPTGQPAAPTAPAQPQVAAQIPPGNGKKLDPQTAQLILQKAGGDKVAARKMAVQLGYTL